MSQFPKHPTNPSYISPQQQAYEQRQSTMPNSFQDSGATATSAIGAQQPIVINMPKQRTSPAVWALVAIVIAGLLFFLGTCVALPLSMMSSLGNMSSSMGSSVSLTEPNSVAVMHWSTSISATSGVTPETVHDALSAAEKDDNIKAVVIRCNSPGGTVAASEEIAQYIRDFEKPIVFSVSDVCASGAYMSAAESDFIMAMPMSEVGSIGVIMSLTDVSGLMEKLGVKQEAITSSDSKDAGSMFRALTDEERAKFQAKVDEYNNNFVNMIVAARGMDEAKVRELATGETYSGKTSLENGLIDGNGTYQDALDKAAELAGISGDYKVHSLDGISNLDSFYSLLLGGNSKSVQHNVANAEDESKIYIDTNELMQLSE